jgi:erythromycin esterase-like protein
MAPRTASFAAISLAVLVACGGSDDAAPPVPTAPTPTPETPPPTTPATVAPGVYPLAGSAPDLEGDDLAALDPLVASADVIGLGESVHTTGGEIHMRLRVLRHLVQHAGVRAIALETSWSRIETLLAPYVRTCSGSALEASKGVVQVWWEVAVPPFFEWLCQWNQAHPADAVEVFGFDIRQPWVDVPAFRTYVTGVDPTGGPKLADDLATCLGATFADETAFFADPKVQGYYAGKPTPEAEHTSCQAAVAAATAAMTTNKAAWVGKTSEPTWDLTRLQLAQIGAFDQTIYFLSRIKSTTDLAKANGARDPVMFDAFTTIRKQRFAGRKVALWAHDNHLARHADEIENAQVTNVKTLGTLIDAALGSSYVVIGQTSLSTGVAFDGKPDELPARGATSFEARIGKLEGDTLLVTLPAATIGEGAPLPPAPMEFGTDPQTLAPARHYDAVIWHRRSDAGVPFVKVP